MQRIQRPRPDQRFEQPAIEHLAAHARGQIEDVGERSARGAFVDQGPDRLDPDPADRGERVADRGAVRAVLNREAWRRCD